MYQNDFHINWIPVDTALNELREQKWILLTAVLNVSYFINLFMNLKDLTFDIKMDRIIEKHIPKSFCFWKTKIFLKQLLQHEPDFFRVHGWTLPVEEVILKISVADAELQLLQELGVFHQVERIEHVKVGLNC